jgi:hypothetical protein
MPVFEGRFVDAREVHAFDGVVARVAGQRDTRDE